MRLLLDTHIWLWSLLEPDKLTTRVVKALEAPDNELWLSPISTWELSVLVKKDRVVLDKDVVEWVKEAMEKVPLQEAPLTHDVALATLQIGLPHRDPADNFLAATAKVFGLTLVTADKRMLSAKGITTLDNR